MNWMTWEAFMAEYQLWATGRGIPEEERPGRTCFRSVCRAWSDRLGFRKIGQHARQGMLNRETWPD